MTHFVSRQTVTETYPQASWQRIVFSEFEATLTSKSRPFPCVFGESGLRKDQLRFAFPDPLTPESLGPILSDYLAGARDFGRLTSLVVFGRPGPVQALSDYRARFWSLLDGLERLDPAPRPADVPRRIDSPMWEFCFGGEPIFVVCNTPAHVLRQSRRSTSFMVTFQPRWVFEGIMDAEKPASRRALSQVRDRLEAFDAIAPAPQLGHYGQPDNREFEQYFLDDTNDAPACPFHQLGRREDDTTTHEKGKVA